MRRRGLNVYFQPCEVLPTFARVPLASYRKADFFSFPFSLSFPLSIEDLTSTPALFLLFFRSVSSFCLSLLSLAHHPLPSFLAFQS
jgi:hypothetical protein